MCGICGIAYDDGARQVDAETLTRLRDRMVHRGPDDAGLYVRKNVGLGHRRLSIIDRSGGQQPLSNEDGSVWIVFNGEIYNYRDLRTVLEGKGHSFRTNSDTETIVHLYEEFGQDCVNYLNGMFAFAIWDEIRESLFLARDRMGVKPLYIWRGAGTFLFASEMKAILDYPAVQRELNVDALPEYLVFRYPTGNRTFFKDIVTLEPGHSLLWKQGEISLKKYWQHQPSSSAWTPSSLEEATRQVDTLLENAVQIRLMSEVPLGTYCSGGVDSSLLTTYAAKHATGTLNTFSVGFEEREFDESRYAEMVSRRCGTAHHRLRVTEQTYKEVLPYAVWLLESPLNHAHSVQLHLISKMAKSFVTVMLSGEGSDELFGGYPRYRAIIIREAMRRFPALLRDGAIGVLGLLSSPRLQKLSAALDGSVDEAIVHNARFVAPSLAQSVLVAQFPQVTWKARYDYLYELQHSESHPLQRLLYLDQKTYLVSLLDRQDKMSMGASIEARVPFLDFRLVKLAMGIRAKDKVQLSESKVILKRLAERYLPKEIVYRNKSGFGVPLAAWFRNAKGLGEYLDYFSSKPFQERGLWNIHAVNRLVAEHRRETADHSEVLWEVLNMELWSRTFLDCGNVSTGVVK